MADTTAYHVGSNVPGYLPEGDVTCWDETSDAREALLTIMFAHVDHLGEACDCDESGDDESGDACDDCDDYQRAKSTVDDVASDGRDAFWREGVTVYLPSGRELPLAFWVEPVSMDHAAECEPLTD